MNNKRAVGDATVPLERPPKRSKQKEEATPPEADNPPKTRKQKKKAVPVSADDPRQPRSAFRIVQVNLDTVVREPALKQKILTVCLHIHKLNIHTYQCLALYLTDLLARRQPLPEIDKLFVIDIAMMIAYSTDQSKRQKDIQGKSKNDKTKAALEQRKAKLAAVRAFFEEHYRPTMVADKIDFSLLQNPIDYMATDIVTALENNIKEHYVDHLERTLETLYLTRYTKDNWPKKEFSAVRKQIKSGQFAEILPTSPVCEHAKWLIPNRPLEKDSVAYDCKCSPQDYLPCLYYMLQVLERHEAKLFALFPLRTSIVPKSVRLDTKAIRERFMTTEDAKAIGFTHKSALRRAPSMDHEQKVWARLFKTELPCFAPPRRDMPTPYVDHPTRFQFDFMIVTDGFSCSIQQRLKADDSIYKGTETKAPTDVYIEQCDNLAALQGLNIVGIDPGKQDLIYCAMPKTTASAKQKRSERDYVDVLRYSAAQRSFECQRRRQRSRLENAVKKAEAIDGKTVEQWQHELSFFQHKTSSFEVLKAYVQKKNQVNSKLMAFWAADKFRKMKWQAKVNQRRSEDQLMERFKAKFGGPEQTMVAMGNWCEDKPRRFMEPTKGKGFRKLFRRRGYKLYLVNEFRTSQWCYNCESKVKSKFHKIWNQKPKRSRERTCCFEERCDGCLARDRARGKVKRPSKRQDCVPCHGLLMCETCKGLWKQGQERKTFWNRDLNGALNIRRVAESIIQGQGRPLYLSRPLEWNTLETPDNCGVTVNLSGLLEAQRL